MSTLVLGPIYCLLKTTVFVGDSQFMIALGGTFHAKGL